MKKTQSKSESKWFHLISGRFQKKPKPKHCASTEQVVSASEFYDFRPCKPWAWRIVFTKRNLVCIRFNSSKRETNKNTKNNSASMNISIDCRHCMYYYYCDGRCKDVITLNLSTWHNIFASFSPLENTNRVPSVLSQHISGWRNKFHRNLRKVWTCQPSAAHSTWMRSISRRIAFVTVVASLSMVQFSIHLHFHMD